MLYYRGYKIDIRACEVDGLDVTRMTEDLAEMLSDFDPSKETAFKFIILDQDDDSECDDSIFDYYDTVEEAMDAINDAWDGSLDMDDDNITFYELSLNNGEKLCMLAVDEPSVSDAESFVRTTLEEGEHVVRMRAITDDEAYNSYNITRDDEDEYEVFSRLRAYELTLSSGKYACMLGIDEPTIQEAEEFISDILDDGEHVTAIERISLECAEDNYGICSDEFNVFERDIDDCEYCDDCEGDCQHCPHNVN